MVDEDYGSGSLLQKVENESFVEVMFAKSSGEAEGWRTFLLERQIPARLEIDPNVAKRCGIAVLVPADRLIEASELLASKAQDDEDFEEFDDDDDEEDADDYDDDYEDDDEEDEEYDDEDLDDEELEDDFAEGSSED